MRREELLLGDPLGPEVLLGLVVGEAEGAALTARAGERGLQLLPEVVLARELRGVLREELLLRAPLGPKLLLVGVVPKVEPAAGAAPTLGRPLNVEGGDGVASLRAREC